jgi:DNA-binding FrmR family transcriptional regulator
VTAATKKVGMVMVETYMEECLERTENKGGAKRLSALKDFKQAMSRYIDWA